MTVDIGSKIVKAEGLIAKGLLHKQGMAGDGRQAMVQLTDAGLALHTQLFPQIQAINQELLGDVSDAELEVLSQVFERVRTRAALMQEQGSFPKAERRRGRAAGKQPARDDAAG